jgi:hypothetical protein
MYYAKNVKKREMSRIQHRKATKIGESVCAKSCHKKGKGDCVAFPFG